MKEKKEKKKRRDERLRKPPSALNFESLDPAIIDGKLVVTKDQTLVLRRARSYEMITLVRITRTYDDGWVSLWDETLGQCFMFNLKTDVAVHDRLKVYDKSRLGKSVLHQELEDGVAVNGETDVGTTLDDEGGDADEMSLLVEEPST